MKSNTQDDLDRFVLASEVSRDFSEKNADRVLAYLKALNHRAEYVYNIYTVDYRGDEAPSFYAEYGTTEESCCECGDRRTGSLMIPAEFFLTENPETYIATAKAEHESKIIQQKLRYEERKRQFSQKQSITKIQE